MVGEAVFADSVPFPSPSSLFADVSGWVSTVVVVVSFSFLFSFFFSEVLLDSALDAEAVVVVGLLASTSVVEESTTGCVRVLSTLPSIRESAITMLDSVG